MKEKLKIRTVATLSKNELINAQEQCAEFILDLIDGHLQKQGITLDDFSIIEQQELIRFTLKQIVPSII